VIPIISGALFGPVVGFVVGAEGRVVGDLLTFGFFWNWDLSRGLVGLIAGLAPLIGAAIRRRWKRIGIATLLGAVGVVLGTGFAALTDVWVANLSPDLAISAEWLSVASRGLALAPVGVARYGSQARGASKTEGRREAALPTLSTRSAYPVVIDIVSVLPKFDGQSVSGHGAPGKIRCPAANELARQFWIALQTAALLAEIHSPTP